MYVKRTYAVDKNILYFNLLYRRRRRYIQAYIQNKGKIIIRVVVARTTNNPHYSFRAHIFMYRQEKERNASSQHRASHRALEIYISGFASFYLFFFIYQRNCVICLLFGFIYSFFFYLYTHT